jgi:hypothetical protein
MQAKVVINRASINERKQRLKQAQSYVDKECLRLMTPYVPVGLPKFRNSGALRDSGKVASPGKVVYTNTWARSNYYNLQHRNFKNGGNPNATPLWFETMKQKHGSAILRGVADITGGKAK